MWRGSQMCLRVFVACSCDGRSQEVLMSQEELAGYTVLAGYAVMMLAAIKVFGLRRVATVLFGVVVLAVAIAFGTLRGVGGRRY